MIRSRSRVVLSAEATIAIGSSTCGAVAQKVVGAACRGCGFEFGQVRRSVDDRGVGKSLREIPELPLGDRVVFLGEQAKIVSEREQALE